MSIANPEGKCAILFSITYVVMPQEALFATENRCSKMNRPSEAHWFLDERQHWRY
jgi:hypothetical protein